VLLGLAAQAASAHPLAPALLELREAPGGRVDVLWRVSRWRAPGPQARPVLPESCRAASERALAVDELAIERRWSVECAPPGLAGRRVAVEGLDAGRGDAIVRVALRDGRSLQSVLRPGAQEWRVLERPRRARVALDYLRLGAAHLFGGLDHLLFVSGLVLLVGGRRRLLGTVTAFTAGHSATLGLATLGVVRAPVAWVELAIAGSLFALALELSRPPGAPAGALARRPWAMAAGFGLLHGFGFASALAEAGLPVGEIPLALAAFNVGIELGQLVVVAGWLALGAALRPSLPRLAASARLSSAARRVPVEALGALAAFWCLERAARLL
jgi:hypothetical protein